MTKKKDEVQAYPDLESLRHCVHAYATVYQMASYVEIVTDSLGELEADLKKAETWRKGDDTSFVRSDGYVKEIELQGEIAFMKRRIKALHEAVEVANNFARGFSDDYRPDLIAKIKTLAEDRDSRIPFTQADMGDNAFTEKALAWRKANLV